MSIEFRYDGTAMLMLYAPAFGHEEVRQKLDSDGLSIKNVFSVTADNEYQIDLSDEYEETFCFKIGELSGDYYRLDKNILNTSHWFYFSKDVVVSAKHFVAHQNISICRKIDDIVDCDVYITDGTDEREGYIPFEIVKRTLLPNKGAVYDFLVNGPRFLENVLIGKESYSELFFGLLQQRYGPVWRKVKACMGVRILPSMFEKVTGDSCSFRDFSLLVGCTS